MMPRLEIVGRKKFLVFFEKKTYRLLADYIYLCPESGRTLTSYEGEEFDGATGALDVSPSAWVPHDTACKRGEWDDSSKITRNEAARILYYTHKAVGNGIRARTWPIATWLFGCKIVRRQ